MHLPIKPIDKEVNKSFFTYCNKEIYHLFE